MDRARVETWAELKSSRSSRVLTGLREHSRCAGRGEGNTRGQVRRSDPREPPFRGDWTVGAGRVPSEIGRSDCLNLVPPTIFRKDGPYGPGSLQFFIEHDPNYHYFQFSKEDLQRLRPVVIFDFLINNADRKGSHVLVDGQNHL